MYACLSFTMECSVNPFLDANIGALEGGGGNVTCVFRNNNVTLSDLSNDHVLCH